MRTMPDGEGSDPRASGGTLLAICPNRGDSRQMLAALQGQRGPNGEIFTGPCAISPNGTGIIICIAVQSASNGHVSGESFQELKNFVNTRLPGGLGHLYVRPLGGGIREI